MTYEKRGWLLRHPLLFKLESKMRLGWQTYSSYRNFFTKYGIYDVVLDKVSKCEGIVKLFLKLINYGNGDFYVDIVVPEYIKINDKLNLYIY